MGCVKETHYNLRRAPLSRLFYNCWPCKYNVVGTISEHILFFLICKWLQIDVESHFNATEFREQ